MDPSAQVLDLWNLRSDYLVYWLDRMLPADFGLIFRNTSDVASGFLQQTKASVAGAVTEVQTQIVDPAVRAIGQPVASLAHGLGTTAQMLRLGTYVAGGWLLYTWYQDYYVEPQRKRVLDDTIEDKLKRSLRRRRL